MTEVKRKNGLKGILVSSVAMMGLSVGVAEGQEVGLQGMMEGGKYGGGARVYMPFGGISSGSVFLGLNGGLVEGKMNGSGVLGYGKGFGDWGVRGYVGAGVEEGKRGDLYTGLKVGGELYVGGFGVRVGGHVAVGDNKKEVVGRRVEGVLLDPSGQQCDPTGTSCVPVPPSCTSPLPGQVKRCVPGVAVTNPSYERALSGFEAEVSYMIPVGGAMITPSLGYERYGKNEVVGLRGGVRIDVPLTSGLSLNVEGGVRKGLRGEENGTTGYAGLGIRYNFGSVPVDQMSRLERRMSEGPKVGQRGGVTQTTKGETTIYRNEATSGQGLTTLPPGVGVIWKMNPRGQYITSVYVVDSANEKNLDDIVAGAPADAIVVVDGRVVIDGTLKIKNDGVGIAGAGNALSVRATFDGGKTFVDTVLPVYGKGRRGVIDGGTLPVVIEAVGVDSPILYGLDLKGGDQSVLYKNVMFGRLEDINADRPMTFDRAVLTKLDTVSLSDDRTVPTGAALLEIKNSYGFDLSNIGLQKAPNGLLIAHSSYVKGSLLDIRDITGNAAINIDNSNNVGLDFVSINNSRFNGVLVKDSSAINLNYMRVEQTGTGLNMTGSTDVGVTGLSVLNSQRGVVLEKDNRNIKLGLITIQNISDQALLLDDNNSQVKIEDINITNADKGIFLNKNNVGIDMRYVSLLNTINSPLTIAPDNKGIDIFSLRAFNDMDVRVSRIYLDGQNTSINDFYLKDVRLVLGENSKGHEIINGRITARLGKSLGLYSLLEIRGRSSNFNFVKDVEIYATHDAPLYAEALVLEEAAFTRLENIKVSIVNSTTDIIPTERDNGVGVLVYDSNNISINGLDITLSRHHTSTSYNVNFDPIRIIGVRGLSLVNVNIKLPHIMNGTDSRMVEIRDSYDVFVRNMTSDSRIDISNSGTIAIIESTVNIRDKVSQSGIRFTNSGRLVLDTVTVSSIGSKLSPKRSFSGIDFNSSAGAKINSVNILIDDSASESFGISAYDLRISSFKNIVVRQLSSFPTSDTIAFGLSGGLTEISDLGGNSAYGFGLGKSKVCDGTSDVSTPVKVYDGVTTRLCD